jgi:hypothetical protein
MSNCIPYECPNCGRKSTFLAIDLARGMTHECPGCGISRELSVDIEPRADPELHVYVEDVTGGICESCSRILEPGDFAVLFGMESFPVCEDCLIVALREITKRKCGGSDDEQCV